MLSEISLLHRKLPAIKSIEQLEPRLTLNLIEFLESIVYVVYYLSKLFVQMFPILIKYYIFNFLNTWPFLRILNKNLSY